MPPKQQQQQLRKQLTPQPAQVAAGLKSSTSSSLSSIKWSQLPTDTLKWDLSRPAPTYSSSSSAASSNSHRSLAGESCPTSEVVAMVTNTHHKCLSQAELCA
jgi:hypothetical protein